MDFDSMLAESQESKEVDIESVLMGEDSEGQVEEETPTDSQPEEVPTEDDPSQEGDIEEDTSEDENTLDDNNVPFHKHPRWKAKQRENEQLKQKLDEFEAKIEEIKKAKSQPEQSNDEQVQIPQEFVELFGNTDPQVYKKFENLVSRFGEAKAKEIVEQRLQAKEQERQKRQQEIQEAERMINESFEQLAVDTGLPLTDENSSERNEILSIAAKYQPTDENGLISIEKAYNIWKGMQGQSSKSVDAQKKVAAQTTENAKKASEDEPMKVGQLRGRDLSDFL